MNEASSHNEEVKDDGKIALHNGSVKRNNKGNTVT